MTCLSISRELGPAVVVANPIFIISRTESAVSGSELIFEVFETDGGPLRSLIGQSVCYAFDGEACWGQLLSLGECTSSHPALEYLRDRPALRGVLRLFPDRGVIPN